MRDWGVRLGMMGLVIMAATGCMSKEDRIKDVIVHEIEKCKQSEDEIYVVVSHDGTEHRVLAELCHLEPSDVEMNTEFSGALTTGPLEWTGGENPEIRAMVLTRVSWGDFDRAMRYRDKATMRIDDYRAAETNFDAAQQAYPTSAWLRLERLKNLLEMRNEQGTEVEDPASIGEDARAHFEELVTWAQSEGEPAVAARARLMVVGHLGDYRDRQQRAIANLGSGDRRLEAAIEASQDQGDREAAAEYKKELEERRERRPQAQARMEEQVLSAEVELCELRQGLSVNGVDDDGLRSRINGALRAVDCDKVRAAQAEARAEAEAEQD